MLGKQWSQADKKSPHEHIHSFENNESDLEKQEWLETTIRTINELGLEVVHAKEEGIKFTFLSFNDLAVFHQHVYGNQRIHHGFTTSIHFEDGTNPDWMDAANMFLNHLGINFTAITEDNTASFAFDYFNEMRIFRNLVEDGAFDSVAKDLRKAKAVLNLIHTPSPGRQSLT